MVLIPGNGGLNIRFYVRDPEEAHPRAKPRVLAYLAVASYRNPEKWGKTSRVNTLGAQSHAYAETKPLGGS